MGSSTTAVDVCSDGSVLATSTRDRTVRRLTIDSTGALTDTGEVLSLRLAEPLNVFCAPDDTSGLVITVFPAELTSFTIPKLNPVDTRMIAENFGISGVVNPAGNRVFARRSYEDYGFVDVFGYNAATAAFSSAPLLSIPVSYTYIFNGIDQVALHPYEAKVYVSDRTKHAVNVYDANTGALLPAMTDPHIVDPTGVTIATDPCVGATPLGAIVGTDGSDVLRGTPGNDVIFGLAGDDVIDGRGGDDLICGGTGEDGIDGGAGNDAITGGSGNDRLRGDAHNDVLSGGAGDDLIEDGTGQDQANGNSGRDIVRCGADDDMLRVVDGVRGNDRVDGGSHVNGDRCARDRGDVIRNCNP